MAIEATTLPGHLREAVEHARRRLDAGRIAELIFDLTATASPTGEERDAAELAVRHLRDAGVAAEVQEVSGRQANAIGRVGDAEHGPRLLLYAPLDTAFTGGGNEDRPFLGDEPRADFARPPLRDGTTITGLGAENPKGFAAAAIAALEAVAETGVALGGEAVAVLASGTMPDLGRPGHGTGIRHFLDHGPQPDFAVVLKPGYAVAHEEVGLAWFRIVVHGTVNYTGIRHKGPYRNPIVAAAHVVERLEAWLQTYSARHTDGLVAAQGSINAIAGGTGDRAAYVPATCTIDLDLRVSPRSTPDDVEGELREALETFRADDPSLDLELHRRIATPGTTTDPDSWIVRSLVRAWEAREGREHVPPTRASGASDAPFLRERGIPTARIGLPPPAVANPFPGFSMGYVDATSVQRLSEVLIHVIIDTCARSREEVGLA